MNLNARRLRSAWILLRSKNDFKLWAFLFRKYLGPFYSWNLPRIVGIKFVVEIYKLFGQVLCERSIAPY